MKLCYKKIQDRIDQYEKLEQTPKDDIPSANLAIKPKDIVKSSSTSSVVRNTPAATSYLPSFDDEPELDYEEEELPYDDDDPLYAPYDEGKPAQDDAAYSPPFERDEPSSPILSRKISSASSSLSGMYNVP